MYSNSSRVSWSLLFLFLLLPSMDINVLRAMYCPVEVDVGVGLQRGQAASMEQVMLHYTERFQLLFKRYGWQLVG